MIKIEVQKQLHSATGILDLNLAFELKKNSLTTLYGKSGAGKTTVLKIISGLLKPDQGAIIVHGNTWLDTQKNIVIPPQRRNIGFLFQEYGLFPNMTVLENIRFALDKGQDQNIIKDLLEIIDLGGLQFHKPAILSGGQQQRVALARALVRRPELLLLDEPLAAVDLETRTKLQHYILQIHREYGLTTLLVSHDIPEILKLSDHVLTLSDGVITKQGNPATVFGIPQQEHETADGIQMQAEVIAIASKNDTEIDISTLIGNNLITITATKRETAPLLVGDKITVVLGSHHPRIQKKE